MGVSILLDKTALKNSPAHALLVAPARLGWKKPLVSDKKLEELMDNLPVLDCEHPNLKPFKESYPGDDEILEYQFDVVRAKWPRRVCPDCFMVCYESLAHYLAGDW